MIKGGTSAIDAAGKPMTGTPVTAPLSISLLAKIIARELTSQLLIREGGAIEVASFTAAKSSASHGRSAQTPPYFPFIAKPGDSPGLRWPRSSGQTRGHSTRSHVPSMTLFLSSSLHNLVVAAFEFSHLS